MTVRAAAAGLVSATMFGRHLTGSRGTKSLPEAHVRPRSGRPAGTIRQLFLTTRCGLSVVTTAMRLVVAVALFSAMMCGHPQMAWRGPVSQLAGLPRPINGRLAMGIRQSYSMVSCGFSAAGQTKTHRDAPRWGSMDTTTATMFGLHWMVQVGPEYPPVGRHPRSNGRLERIIKAQF